LAKIFTIHRHGLFPWYCVTTSVRAIVFLDSDHMPLLLFLVRQEMQST
jgi:hypothetical protein